MDDLREFINPSKADQETIQFNPDWIYLPVSPSKLAADCRGSSKLRSNIKAFACLTSSKFGAPEDLSSSEKIALKSPQTIQGTFVALAHSLNSSQNATLRERAFGP